MPHAQNITIQEQSIYIVHLDTLLERRWHTKKSLPWHGNESCPNSPEGDIWHDYKFDTPGVTVLNPSKSLSKDLEQTRRKEECLHCQNNKEVKCSHCNGRVYIVTWTELSVKWFNNSSKILFPSNYQNFCPLTIID